MKCFIQTDSLRNALNKILSVVDKKNTRPILSYTLISTKDDKLEFSATDLEVSAKVTIPANVENQGTFCVNAKNLYDIVRELPEGEVEMVMKNNQTTLNLNCQNIHYSLLIYNNEEFPHLNFCNEAAEFNLNSAQLLEMINKTSYAIATDETRLYLNGIYIQEIDSKLRAVATDGHRLSLLETEFEDHDNRTDNLLNGIIIPRKGVHELKKIAESFPSDNLKISVDDSFIYANAEGHSLSIRLISREYPKYQAVIPSKTTYSMKADRNTFFDAVRRIRIMSNEKSNGVRLKLNQDKMTISANHPSLGEALETIPVSYSGTEMEIGFNAKYLIDSLQTLSEGEISLELNNELSPVIIKSQNIPNYLGIIMPLKL